MKKEKSPYLRRKALRENRIQDLAETGFNVDEVIRMTGWKSDLVSRVFDDLLKKDLL